MPAGAAYAANTVFSSDIVNGEVKTQDIATEGVATQDIAPSAVTSGRVDNNTLTGADIKEPTLQKVESCTDGGLMLNYANQSSSIQVIRQVRYSQTGSFVTRSTFAAGAEGQLLPDR
jgi:hypothetical protein